MAELTLTAEGRAKWLEAQGAGETFEVTKVVFGFGRAANPTQVTFATGVISPFVPVREMGPSLLVVEQVPGVGNPTITLRWGIFPAQVQFNATEAMVVAEYPAGTEFALFYEEAPTGQVVFQNLPGQAGYYVGFYTLLPTDPPPTTVAFATGAGLPGTETRTGVLRLASQAEVNAGTDVRKVITPATLANTTLLHNEGEVRISKVVSGTVVPSAYTATQPFMGEVQGVEADGTVAIQAVSPNPRFPVLVIDQANLPTAETLAADQDVRATGLVGPVFINQLRLHPAAAQASDRYEVDEVFYLKSTSPSSSDPFQKTATAYPAGRVIDATNAATGLYDVLFNPLVSPAGQNAKERTTAYQLGSGEVSAASLLDGDFFGATGLIVIVYSGQGGFFSAGQAAPTAGGQTRLSYKPQGAASSVASIGAVRGEPGVAGDQGANRGRQDVRKLVVADTDLTRFLIDEIIIGAGGTGTPNGEEGRIEFYPVYPG